MESSFEMYKRDSNDNKKEEFSQEFDSSHSDDKVADKHANDSALDRVPSNLTNNSLPSISKGQSFVAKIAKSINENTNLSQTSNDLEFGESTLGSQFNNVHPINISSSDDSNNNESVSTSSNNLFSEKSIQKESVENNQNEQLFNILLNDNSNNDESISISSNDPFFEKSIQKEKSTSHIRKKIFKEKDTSESIKNNQNEQIGNEPDTLELDYNDNLLIFLLELQIGSTPMSKNYKTPFYYAEKLEKQIES
ncbi:hypothetical protein F8M41_003198 [Gigaspora margarita]|uniref:Uncharacterized protein n=1 Tax=Gigaspora margarita TaxID=4874 RepID=A0A8H4AY83_GIGMA|nr:hypothetical protein F8M41_003198 [Gigaspora margarita]